TELRRALCSERRVVNGDGEPRAPAGRRHAGEPGEEPRRTATQHDAGHAGRQAAGAPLSDLAPIVAEGDDEGFVVVFARRAKNFADATKVGLIVEREATEGGGLAFRQEMGQRGVPA